jgi:hypothetical protein
MSPNAPERRVALIVLLGCCVILACWIVVLAAFMPHRFNVHHWRAVWVGFDVFLLAGFAATAWAAWRERLALIPLLFIMGTMLCCDAWFDCTTALDKGGFAASFAMAVLAELPLAALAFTGGIRLLRVTAAARGRRLRDLPLAGRGLDEVLPHRGRR